MFRIEAISFCGKPQNYAKIDNYVSRSAQPQKDDFLWLKKHGVTDIFNFRTMHEAGIDFNEKEVVENLGMKYHNIPSITMKPSDKNIETFLDSVNNIIKNNGKAHIHCKAGADRTGMYAFIYKMTKHIGTIQENTSEWVKMGHNTKLYPNLINQTINIVKKYML